MFQMTLPIQLLADFKLPVIITPEQKFLSGQPRSPQDLSRDLGTVIIHPGLFFKPAAVDRCRKIALLGSLSSSLGIFPPPQHLLTSDGA